MSTYVLVHGAWHGAWCWDKLIPLLQNNGHSVIAPDLPAHGQDRTAVTNITLQSYVDKVCEVIHSQAEPVILVGHSLGGLSITLAAEQCPDEIEKLVYLAAFLLPDGQALSDYAIEMRSDLIEANKIMSDDNTCVIFNNAGVKPTFYHDCSDEDVSRASALLVPEPLVALITPVFYNSENFGQIPKVYIECLEDRAIPAVLQKRMYTEAAVDHVITMTSSHSPFFSAAEELSKHLHNL